MTKVKEVRNMVLTFLEERIKKNLWSAEKPLSVQRNIVMYTADLTLCRMGV